MAYVYFSKIHSQNSRCIIHYIKWDDLIASFSILAISIISVMQLQLHDIRILTKYLIYLGPRNCHETFACFKEKIILANKLQT